jgi:hypothetical protein
VSNVILFLQVLLQMATSYVKNNPVMKLRPAPLIKDCPEISSEGAIWNENTGGLLVINVYNK